MDKLNRVIPITAFFLLLISACVPNSGQRIDIPTLAVIPSATPTVTDTPTRTHTPADTPTRTPSRTPTPNRAETEIAGLQQTNAAVQATLDTLLTQSVPTLTPSITQTPSQTPLPTAIAMPAQWVYAQGTANMRTCAQSGCEVVAQLQTGEAVAANGTVQGEALQNGNTLWYRVTSDGRDLYVYSQLVAFTPPTLPPASAPTPLPPTAVPSTSAPVISAPPISQPQSSAGCPDVKASCSALTCDQAYACLAAGNSRLDGDKDGVPCESICN